MISKFCVSVTDNYPKMILLDITILTHTGTSLCRRREVYIESLECSSFIDIIFEDAKAHIKKDLQEHYTEYAEEFKRRAKGVFLTVYIKMEDYVVILAAFSTQPIPARDAGALLEDQQDVRIPAHIISRNRED